MFDLLEGYKRRGIVPRASVDSTMASPSLAPSPILPSPRAAAFQTSAAAAAAASPPTVHTIRGAQRGPKMAPFMAVSPQVATYPYPPPMLTSTALVTAPFAPSTAQLDTFLSQMEHVRSLIAHIEANTQILKLLHEHILSAVDRNQARRSADEMATTVEDTNRTAQEIRDTLRTLAPPPPELATNIPSAEYRIRQMQHTNVARSFLEALREHEEIQAVYKQRYHSRAVRQLQICEPHTQAAVPAIFQPLHFLSFPFLLTVQPSATRDEIEGILSEDWNEELLLEQSMTAASADSAAVYLEVAERNRDIRKIERSMQELHQIFVDFASLVEMQESSIDRIADNVAQSQEYVQQGVVQVKEARKLQSKSRKKMFIIICIVATLIITAISLGVGIPLLTKE